MESEENRCRICLEEDVDVPWNAVLYGFSDLTYKDCYYKYTHLEYFDDNFPTMLCRNCTNGLEYIDAFISKAIETHVLLQERFINNMIKGDEVNIIPEPTNFETILMEETEIKTEMPKPVYDDSFEELLKVPAENKTYGTYISEASILQSGKEKKSKFTKEDKSKGVRSKKTQKKRKCLKKDKSKYGADQLEDDVSIVDEKKLSNKMKQSVCCTICSKVLSSKYKAIKHEKTHIKNRERNETCEECGLKFFSRDTLKSHMLTHLENREKGHKCEFCDKAFYNRGGLNVHRRIHLGQMVPCSLCSKQFFRQIDLDKHMNSHSAVQINSTVKTKTRCVVRCKDCGKSMLSGNFKAHNAKHMNEPLFKCSICNKEFFNRSNCVKHLKGTHNKANEDVINFIIAYKKKRISHLYLQQNGNIQVNDGLN